MVGPRIRAGATRVGLVALTVIATSVAPPPENPTPTQCLDAWDRDPYEISYHGDGWPGALVAMGSGTGHPISEADEDYFVGCRNIVIARGTATDDGGGRTQFDLTIGRTKSRAFVDNARRFTYSLYTSDNDWRACYLAWVTEFG